MVKQKPQFFRVIEASDGAADSDETPTEQVGAFLREARQNTGRSLADVAASLCIRAKFLQAIEDGRYEDLPGPTYAVGFIRSYADHLGLDTDALLAQFKTESSAVEGHPDLDFPVPSTVGWFPTGPVVASCAVLAAAVFGGWFYLQTENSVDVSTVPSPPGYKSADAKPVGTRVLNTVAAAAETVGSITRAENGTSTTTNTGTDDGAKATDQVATAPPAVSETAAPGTVTADSASDDGERPHQLPVPIAALATPDPLATETDLKQPRPVETASAASPAAAVAADATPASVSEPPVQIDDGLTPASASDSKTPPAARESTVTELPSQTAAAPTPTSASESAPPPIATLSRTAEPPSPPPTAPDPVVQVAALPNIPADGSGNNSSEAGRTYGVINQEARVIIGAQADSWVQVLDGNQTVLLTRMLRAGDRYLVPNRNDLVMLTGNAGGLVISVDGQAVPRIGLDGAILHNVRLDIELLKAGRAVIE